MYEYETVHETYETKSMKLRNTWNHETHHENHKTQDTTKSSHETILSWWNLWLWILRNLWKRRNLEITKLMKAMKTMRRRNFNNYHKDLKPNTMNAMKPLSSAEAFLCCREAGEKEKESRGTMGSGTREETREAPVFSLFPSFLARFLFSIIAIFIGIPSGEPLQRREQWSLDSLAYVLPSLPLSRSFP